ncbi:MAG: hypothetical protein M1838_000610 [Thelocarpon superellum]|nr:MAG: hypothetical protein M1838_000610 [Thelocarpon superellum]
MHFALPPRKTSHPPPYAPRQSRPSVRIRRLQLLGLLSLATLAVIYLLSRLFLFPSDRPPPGTPEVVIVTTLDSDLHPPEYLEKIKENRRAYAKLHGYATFFPSVTDYDLGGAPSSWARIPAVRHAMALYPHTTFFFQLDQHALIMNPALTVTSHIMSRSRLEFLMLKDIPVVPPDSVIKTFSHLRGDRIDLVLTQDGDGLSQDSFVLRQGDWAPFFLDAWFDPLYRQYNFQKAEVHALEHLVQWHSTVLAKLALVPQRILNSYSQHGTQDDGKAELYKPGDFVMNMAGCDTNIKRNCATELQQAWTAWIKALESSS